MHTLFISTMYTHGQWKRDTKIYCNIYIRVEKGNWNGKISRNNRKKVDPLSVLERVRTITLRDVYYVGVGP